MISFRDFLKADIVPLESCALYVIEGNRFVGPYLLGDINFDKLQLNDCVNVLKVRPTYMLSRSDRDELVRLAYLGYPFPTMYILLEVK